MNNVTSMHGSENRPHPAVVADAGGQAAGVAGGALPRGPEENTARVKAVLEFFLESILNQAQPHPEWVESAHAAADRLVERAYGVGALDSALEISRIGMALQEMEKEIRPWREVRVLIRGLRMALDRAWLKNFPAAPRELPSEFLPPRPLVPAQPATPGEASRAPGELPTDGTFSYLGTSGFPFDAELTQIFLTEVGEQIPAAERILLDLESHPEQSRDVNELFRVMHTIKGNAGFLGLREVIFLVHTMEHYLEPFRSRELPIAEMHTALLLEGVDILSRMLANLHGRAERLAGKTDVVDPEPVAWESLNAKLQAVFRS